MKNVIYCFTFFLFICALNSCQVTKPINNDSPELNKILYQYKWYLSDLNGSPYTYAGRGDNESDSYTWIMFNNDKPAKISGSIRD